MINRPSPVTENGDLTFHAKEGVRLPIQFELEDGSPRNMTAATVKFYIEGGPTITLDAGETDDEKVLIISQGSCNSFIGKRVPFVMVDETVVPHAVEWGGDLLVTGFA